MAETAELKVAVDAGTPATASTVAARSMPWWQWVLLYPTLFVAVLGALPTLKDLIMSLPLPVHVPLGKAGEAVQQLALLKANFACTQDAMNHPSGTHGEVTIGAAVCASGDVAVVAQNAGAGAFPNPVIVPLSSLVGGTPLDAHASLWHLLQPVASAYAQGDDTTASTAREAKLVCQKLPDDKGDFLRRIRKPDGRCVDVVSNAYNRTIVSQKPAPCTPTC